MRLKEIGSSTRELPRLSPIAKARQMVSDIVTVPSGIIAAGVVETIQTQEAVNLQKYTVGSLAVTGAMSAVAVFANRANLADIERRKQ